MNKIDKNAREAFKKIPSVDELLKKYQPEIPISFFKYNLNLLLKQIRKEISQGKLNKNIGKYTYSKVSELIKKISINSLKEVINGTGIILHTGLGRAPISKDILIDSINKTNPYSNLEINLGTGKRGDRNIHVSSLLNSLCNSESSLITNNNASAVMLMLNSLCDSKEVIISRGQQVEIGGSFRIPDVIKKSNCKMVEIGTTNKTHLEDYEEAINKNTGAILYVHTSNYKVVGFTNEINIKELSKLSKKRNIPLLIDLGSGSIADYKFFGLPMEKMVTKYLKLGANLIAFSGDKLLGGPQAGVLAGDKNIIDKIFVNPIYRAVRCDKLRISIMENILRTYYSSKDISDINLTLHLFKRNRDAIRKIAKKIINSISKIKIKKYSLNYQESFVEAGSGSLPNEKIPSVALSFKSKEVSTQTLFIKFLNSKTPIIGYIKNNIFYIDLKAIPNEQITLLIDSINEVL